jgi:SSS family solute:Na+ symporter
VHPLNWAIVIGWIGFVVYIGIRRSRGTQDVESYFLANRSLPWWVVGLSVMATQLSAITMIGTTGQGATDGIRFIQFYFGLPLAMVILGVTLVPFLHGAKVYTAYEYLERRFNPQTRSLTAFLFLLSRGMSCGTIISAPAVVFSTIFGWNPLLSVAIIGVPTVIYTMIGGVRAVAWVDVKQMVLIVTALFAVVITLLIQIPVSPYEALQVAGASGRLAAFDFSFSLTNTYTFWSGVIGGTFLMLSYFGTDQSQVQRYLTARSVDEARSSLLMSAYWKIPLQALVLLIGVLVFVFYVFNRPPLYYNPVHERAMSSGDPVTYEGMQADYYESLALRDSAARRLIAAEATAEREAAAREFRLQGFRANAVREGALIVAQRVTGVPARDVNYVIPRFVLAYLPLGLAGIFIAAVLAAAMNAIAAELNSLATTSVMDFYKRWVRAEGTDRHFLMVSRAATLVWGLFACFIATFAADLGSLIEVVNKFGSFFYGPILGVFLLAMIPRSTGHGAFFGCLAAMAAVALVVVFAPTVSFLWWNVVGAMTVVIVGSLISSIGPRTSRAAPAA